MDCYGLFGRVTNVTRFVKATFFISSNTRSLSHCARLHTATGTGSTADLEADDHGKPVQSHVRRGWTVAELDTFYRMREESATATQIAEALGRTITSVNHMRDRAGRTPSEVLRKRIRMQNRPDIVIRPWLPQDDSKMLALLANGHSHKSAAAELDRSVMALESRMKRLAVLKHVRKTGHWTTGERSLVKSLRAAGLSSKSIASRLGRDLDCVRDRVRRMNSPTPRDWAMWTADEDKRLEDMKERGLDWAEIHKTMPHRTAGSVQARYYHVGLNDAGSYKREGPWTAEETSKLRDLVARKKSKRDMVAALGRTAINIATKMALDRSVGLVRGPGTKWKKTEFENLRRMREDSKRTWQDIAALLGRSPASCSSAYTRYVATLTHSGSSGKKRRTKWRSEDIAKLVRLREARHTFSEIAALLGRSARSCQTAHWRNATSRPSSGESKGSQC